MARVRVESRLLTWALGRSGRTVESARARYAKFSEWMDGTGSPTLRQLEDFANWTRTPLGFLLLETPPDDRLPIPDFRTAEGRPLRPSPDLLQTVQSMQRRQAWMREFLSEEEHQLTFVGTCDANDPPAKVAQSMREVLNLHEDWAKQANNWTDALRILRQAVELGGIMVVINGVVGNNNHRPLNVDEFRGFVLVDTIAPLVFVNGQDAKSAQMFTLAHELAHLWIGQEGVSNLDRLEPVGKSVETACNRIAAEFLVPAVRFELEWLNVSGHPDRLERLAKIFKVSTLVVARRALDLRHISRREFFDFYDRHIQESRKVKPTGGDFWKTQRMRIGELFGAAVAQAVWAGRLLYRDAYELTDLRGRTFDNYIAGLGL